MPGWMPPVLAVLALALAAFLLWRWQRRTAPGGASVGALLAATGPVRCAVAIRLLRRLAAGHPARIVAALERIELPLLEALPDCPPPDKPELADALQACALAVANRDAAKRLMVLRNALLG